MPSERSSRLAAYATAATGAICAGTQADIQVYDGPAIPIDLDGVTLTLPGLQLDLGVATRTFLGSTSFSWWTCCSSTGGPSCQWSDLVVQRSTYQSRILSVFNAGASPRSTSSTSARPSKASRARPIRPWPAGPTSEGSSAAATTAPCAQGTATRSGRCISASPPRRTVTPSTDGPRSSGPPMACTGSLAGPTRTTALRSSRARCPPRRVPPTSTAAARSTRVISSSSPRGGTAGRRATAPPTSTGIARWTPPISGRCSRRGARARRIRATGSSARATIHVSWSPASTGCAMSSASDPATAGPSIAAKCTRNPGASDACMDDVCFPRPPCCTDTWDDFCVQLASAFCDECP